MSFSAVRASAALALASLVLLSGLPTSASGVVSAPAAVTDGVSVRVGTYNIIASVSPGTFEAAVDAFRPRVDVAGLQEVNSRDKEAALEAAGWDYYRPENGRQNPVIWDATRFVLLGEREVRVADATDIGNEVPGRSGIIGAHYATVVRLLDRESGRNISVVNMHLPPGAVKNGVRREDRPRLYKRYVRELRAVVALAAAEQQWGQVFVLGDFNIGFVPDEKHRVWNLPFASFRRMGMKSMWATSRPAGGGTRLTALLDQVYSTTRATSTSIGFDLTYSDHRPAVAVYTLPTVPLP